MHHNVELLHWIKVTFKLINLLLWILFLTCSFIFQFFPITNCSAEEYFKIYKINNPKKIKLETKTYRKGYNRYKLKTTFQPVQNIYATNRRISFGVF